MQTLVWQVHLSGLLILGVFCGCDGGEAETENHTFNETKHHESPASSADKKPGETKTKTGAGASNEIETRSISLRWLEGLDWTELEDQVEKRRLHERDDDHVGGPSAPAKVTVSPHALVRNPAFAFLGAEPMPTDALWVTSPSQLRELLMAKHNPIVLGAVGDDKHVKLSRGETVSTFVIHDLCRLAEITCMISGVETRARLKTLPETFKAVLSGSLPLLVDDFASEFLRDQTSSERESFTQTAFAPRN